MIRTMFRNWSQLLAKVTPKATASNHAEDRKPEKSSGLLLQEIESRILLSASPIDLMDSAAESMEGLETDFAEFYDSQSILFEERLEEFNEFLKNQTDLIGSSFTDNLLPSEITWQHIVFVDERLEDIDSLLDQFQYDSNDTLIVAIESEVDGIDQITKFLDQPQHQFETISIFSHGSQGSLQLGSTLLNSESLSAYQDRLSSWQNGTTDQADILLYGCQVAEGNVGRQFVMDFAAMTGADVAASSDLTGSSQLGGDWDLEFLTGSIEASVFINPDQAGAWNHTLATVSVSNTNDLINGVTTSIADLIANDGGDGISLREAITAANNSAGSDQINFAISGGGVHTINLAAELPEITETIFIDGWSQSGYGNDGVPVIEIDGTGVASGGRGFRFNDADGSVMRGLSIVDFASTAIHLDADNTHIYGNYIGLRADGSTAGSNGGDGIFLSGHSQNNIIGTDADGTNDTEERNVISGNLNGIYLTGSNQQNNIIAGNYIGTTADGLVDQGNTNYGILINASAANNTIGGSQAAAQNVISGNGLDGIQINSANSSGNTIQNNIIGLNATGTGPIANDGHGIQILSGADNTTITGNIISGNELTGITVNGSSTGTVIQGNTIGTDSTGTYDFGNWQNGIVITGGASGNTIGGTAAGQANTIAFNGRTLAVAAGISVDGGTTTGNSIRGNSIYGNYGVSIDLGVASPDGQDENDASDSDAGGNNKQNNPVLKSATIEADGDLIVSLDMTSLAAGTYQLDFYASDPNNPYSPEGKTYLGSFPSSDVANTALAYTFSGISLAAGQLITVTATDASGNTSEFSNAMVLTTSYTGGSASQLNVTSVTSGGVTINTGSGNNAYLEAEDGGSILGGLTQFTFESKFSISAISTWVPLLSYGTDSNANEVAIFLYNGSIRVYMSGSISSTAIDYNILADGNVHDFGFSWDSSGGAWKVYIDGQLTDSGSGLAAGTTIGTGGTLLFGQEQDTVQGSFDPTQIFQGTYLNSRIFNDVRTDQEILDNYQNSLDHDEQGLVANWIFDNLSSEGIITETVSGNNLTVRNYSRPSFTDNEPSLSISVSENAVSGTEVATFQADDIERSAKIAQLLAADPNLYYDEITGKFYKVVSSTADFSTSQSNAQSTTLGGVSGDLVIIGSAHENEFVLNLAKKAGGNIWLSGGDSDTEGQWYWTQGGQLVQKFWSGDGSGESPDGVYTNWNGSEPNDSGGEDHIELRHIDGKWNDNQGSTNNRSVIQWDADAVLDATDAIVYSIVSQTVDGAFSIDSSSGKLVIADGAKIDYESVATHSVTVRVTDSDGNTTDKTFQVDVENRTEVDNNSLSVSAGIQLNNDGGNDAYLMADNGGNVLGGKTAFTIEISFIPTGNLHGEALLSYASSGQSNEVRVYFDHSGNLDLQIDSDYEVTSVSASDFTSGQLYTLSYTWDNSDGDWAIYIDGVLRDSGNHLSENKTIDSGGTLILGQEQDSQGGGFENDEMFHGVLYDVRVWDHARTSTQVNQYLGQKLPGSGYPSGLVANWQMDGFNGSNQVVDIVSANNLSIGHASGSGFSTSTPSYGFTIDEGVENGTVVGKVYGSGTVGSDSNVVSDGNFQAEGNTGPGGHKHFDAGETFGGWTVRSGKVDLIEDDHESSPTGGWSVDLNHNETGGIYQNLTTVPGVEYQISFAFSGRWDAGEAQKDLRVTAGGVSQDFSITQPTDWSTSNMQWEHRTFTFVANSTTTVLDFLSLDAGDRGPVIADVQVVAIPATVQAVLNSNPSLKYDAGTGKFYKHVKSSQTWTASRNLATAETLNGVSGSLIQVDSAYENNLIHQWILGEGDVWLGGSDSGIEGDWKWYQGNSAGDSFWSGNSSGSAVGGAWTNFESGQPDSSSSDDDYLVLKENTGLWNDSPTTINDYIIQWDVSEVVSKLTFSLADDADGAFAINSETGEITVADTSKIDYESGSTETITVRYSDIAGNFAESTVTININDDSDDPGQTTPDTVAVNEGNSVTFNSANSNQITVSAPGGGSEVLRVDLSVPNGSLTLSTTSGITFLSGSNGSGSMQIFGTQDALNTALDNLVFTPPVDFNGEVEIEMSTSLQDGLVGHYTFDGGSGTDESYGTQQNGSFVADAHITAEAGRGNVLELDGTNDRLAVNGFFGNPSNVTLAAWVNVTSGGDLISMGDNYAMRLFSDDSIQVFFYNGSTWQSFTTANVGVLNSGWVHVATTFDDVANSQKLFVNGVEVGSASHSASIVYGLGSETRVGCHGSNTNSYDVQGKFDDVRIYNKALSTSEIQSLFSGNVIASGTITVDVTPVNDAPELLATGNLTLPTISENDVLNLGSSVANIIASDGGDRITDADGDPEGIAIYSLTSTHGTWQYSVDSGSTWTDVGSVSSSSSLLLRSTDYIRFVPDGNNGETANFDFRAWDQTSGTTGTKVSTTGNGGSSAFSSSTNSASITVTQVNAAPTDISPGSVSVNENVNASSGYSVATLSTTDSDAGDTFTYSIVGGADASKFSIGGSGNDELILTDASVDFEAKSSYSVQVQVTDSGGATYQKTITVNVNDVNEAATIAWNGSYVTARSETTFGSNFRIGEIQITDDALGTNNLSITGADASNFEIIGNEVFVKAGTVLDYENQTALNITINVDDPSIGGGVDHSFNYTLNVADVDEFDVGPISDNNASANQVVDNASVGAVVGYTAHAVDADGTNNAITYSLSNDDGGRFTIDANSGVVTLAQTVDRQTDGDVRTITVVATSADGSTSSVNVDIGIVSAGGIPIHDVPAAQTVDEDNSITFSSSNGNAVTVTSPGSASELLEVKLSVENGSLTLSQTSGLTIISGSNGSATVTVQGTEADINAALEGMTFNPTADYVGNANLQIQSHSVKDLVGHYKFDGDATNAGTEGASHNGNLVGNAFFVQDPSRGQVLQLDGTGDFVDVNGTYYGNPQNITLSIWVNVDADNAGGAEFISLGEDVWIILNGGGSNSLMGIFSDGSQYRITQGTLTADEPIEGTGWRHIAYTFDDVNNVQKLYLDGTLIGQTSFTESIDYYTLNKIRFGGYAQGGNESYSTDGKLDDARIYSRALTADEITKLAGDTFQTTSTVSITVTNHNDAPTLDTNGSFSLTTVDEDDVSNNGDTVAAILASSGSDRTFDADGDPDGIAVTSLSSGNGTWQYSTDAGSSWTDIGSVSESNALLLRDTDLIRFVPDQENADTANFDFRLWDQTVGSSGTKVDVSVNGGGSAFSSDSDSASISVTAVNDAPTGATNNSFTIAEGTDTSGGYNLGNLIAQDVDNGDTFTYSIVGGPDGSKFSVVNASTGQLEFNDGVLDFEDQDTYQVVVRVTDAAGAFVNQTVVVTVSDTNDAPTVSVGSSAVSISENTDTSSRVFITNINVSDDASGTNNLTITGPDSSFFEVDGGQLYLKAGVSLDYESKTQYQVTVNVDDPSVGSDPDDSVTVTLSLTDQDEFDVSAVTDTDASANSVNENASIGTSVGITAFASDADGTNNAITYSLSNDAGGRFAINSSTGEVTVAGSLDYESATSHTIEVTATSTDGSSSVQTFNIAINDLDEFDISSISDTDASSNSVSELASAGTSVGIVAYASDADGTNNAVTYSLSDDAGGLFTINSSTGEVTVAGGLDFETATNHSIEVTATSTDGSTSTQTFTIAVSDEDEFDVSPVSDSDAAANQVDENASVGTSVGITASAVDLDGTNNTVTYSLSDDASGRFAINSSTGEVTVAGALDFEAVSSHSIEVTATSSDGSSSVQTFSISINDLDEFDVSPISDTDAASNSVSESASVGTSVGITAFASDVDGTNNTVTYSLSDDAGGLFAINTSTGEVTVAAGLDFETSTSHTIEVTATSADGSTSTQTYSISVTDEDEFDVSAVTDSDANANAVDENASVGTSVGIIANAIDADGSNNTVTYSLSDDAGGRFAINSSTGEVTVAGGLDYESATSHTIEVTATSSDGSTSTQNFLININDLDEFDVSAIVDSNSAANTVSETASVGTSVGIVATASDADGSNNTITYSLIDDEGGRFAINSSTGEITVASALDFESATGHGIEVMATSADGSTSTQTYFISVIDEDEFDISPVTDTNAATNAVDENASVGTSVGIIANASDADGTNNTVSYSLSDDAGGRFAIHSSTGEVTVAGSLDFESATSHNIEVTATSSDGSTSVQTFSIAINDLDEFNVSPISDTNIAANTVSESASVGSSVGIVAFASDADGTNNAVTYSLSNDAGGLFAINASTGEVTVAGVLDFETLSNHSIEVTATSADGSTSTQTFAISVTDEDEFDVAAIVDSDSTANAVDENATVGTSVGIIANASDADGTNNTVTYSLSNDAGGLFAINSSTGEVTVAGSMDFESATNHTIEVTAASSDGSTSTQTFSISVNDLDEFDVSPISDSDAAANTASESASVGTSVGLVAFASDADGSNNTVTYSLSDNAGGRFAINSSTGEVTVASGLDFESSSSHSIEVTATSSDGSVSTRTFTIAVTDEDEFDISPVSDSDSSANSVNENVSVGTTVGIIASANDADGTNSTVTYSLSDDAGGLFAINSSTGEVTVAGSIDFETAANHTIEVTATSSDGSSSVQSFSIAVNDLDEFDVSPISDSDGSSNVVSESASVGTSVGLVAFATDADGTNSTVTYSLSDDAGGLFAINSSTGEVTVASALDYESAISHSIEVTATSADGSSSVRTFTISVNDEDEFDVSPVVDSDSSSNNVDENSSVGTTVGIIANAFDADGTNNNVTYNLSNNAGGRFAINAATGEVTVSGSLDYENATNHTIEVTATSSDGSSSVQTFLIAVNDIDEFDVSPISDSDGSANTVSESASVGMTVGVVAFANDADGSNNSVTYSLSDDASGLFQINSSTGEVTVAAALDFEVATNHNIEVTAISADGSSSVQTFTILVTDVDEFDMSPISDADSQANQVLEHAAIGDSVGITANAFDADGTNNVVTYQLMDDAGGRFAIDSNNGVVTVAGALDFETDASHTIQIQASSSDGSFSVRSFTIAVIDQNDNPTDIGLVGSTVSENSATGQIVGTLATVDQDSSDSHIYEIRSGNDHNAFAIDVSGRIVVNQNVLNFETQDTYHLTIRSTDQAGLFVERVFQIDITDINDRPVGEDSTVNTLEDQSITGSVITAGTLDEDGDSLSVQLVNGPSNAESFHLDSDGSFEYSPVQDFNGTESFSFRLYDGQDYSDLMTVTLNVGPVNDAPVGESESYELDQGTTLQVEDSSVLNNDQDVDGDALIATLVALPQHGTITFNQDGTFTYQPDPTYFGQDQFTYVLNDGTVDGNTVQVSLEVKPVDFGSESSASDGSIGEDEGGSSSSDSDDTSSESTLDEGEGNDSGDSVGSEGEGSRFEEELQSEPESSVVGPYVKKGTSEGIDGNEDRVSAFSDADASRREGLVREAKLNAETLASKLLTGDIASRSISFEQRDIILQKHAIATWFFDSSMIWNDSTTEATGGEQEVEMKERLIQGSILTGSLMATAGYFLWTLRGGILMATFMSSLPNWRFIDPLPVVDSFNDQSNEISGEVGLQEMLGEQD